MEKKKFFVTNAGLTELKSELHDLEKVINILDEICFYLQKKYMGEITNETIKKNIAKFHPRKTGEYIMQLYSARIKLFDEEKNNITLPQRAHIPTYKN